ncbi:MAG TPA: hypothetical protein VGA56_25100 [Opitutaceae bacterium]
MKPNTKTLLIRSVIATGLLTLGFARFSQLFDPVMASGTNVNEPTKLSGPIFACHLIEKPAEKVG